MKPLQVMALLLSAVLFYTASAQARSDQRPPSVANRPLRSMQPESGSVLYALDFSPDGALIASGGVRMGDNGSFAARIQIWDAKTGKLRLAWSPANAECIGEVAFSPNGKTLASFRSAGYKKGTKGSIEIWDAATGKLESTLDTSDNSISKLIYSADGSLLAYSDANGAYLWDLQQDQLLRTVPFEGGCAWKNSLELIPQTNGSKTLMISRRQVCACQLSDKSIGGETEFWNFETGQMVQNGQIPLSTKLLDVLFPSSFASSKSLLLLPNMSVTLWSGWFWPWEGRVICRNLQSGRIIKIIGPLTGFGSSSGEVVMAVCSSKKLVATAAPYGAIKVWDSGNAGRW